MNGPICVQRAIYVESFRPDYPDITTACVFLYVMEGENQKLMAYALKFAAKC